MVHWMLWILPFYHNLINWFIPVIYEKTLDYISYMIWCWIFLEKLMSLLLISCMCLTWLNMNIFSRILVLKMFLSLRSVMTCNLLYFTVSCLFELDSKVCCNGIGYFLKILRIQELVLFLSGNIWFHMILFVDWEIYDMLWCSQYFATMSTGVLIGGKLILTSNISSLMKGWYKK